MSDMSSNHSNSRSATCKRCKKSEMPIEQQGSLTGYIFRHKYCQCNETKRLVEESNSDALCSICHKQVFAQDRVGSITSYLFWYLRCHCPRLEKEVLHSGRTALQRKIISQTQAGAACSFDDLTEPDAIIGGCYRVIEQIGRGGMGVVVRAVHKATGHHRAVKILAPEYITNDCWIRFQNEARLLGRLSHPALVKVYDLALHEGKQPFYAMDLVSGSSLEALIIDQGFLSLEQTIEIFLAILDGVAFAHRNGIVHRDLKPSNIMICSEATASGLAQVKVLDFGIVKFLQPTDLAEQGATMSDDILGSPFYMSPEQVQGGRIDLRSDIYSLGCTLFETLTGYVPFDSENAMEVCLMHQGVDPPRLRDVRPSLSFSDSIEYVVGKCLAKAPSARYQTVKELAIDLERIAAGHDLAQYRTMELSTRSGSIQLGPVSKEENRLLKAAALWLLLGGAIIVSFLSIAFQSDWRATFDNLASRPRAQVDAKERERFTYLRPGLLQVDLPDVGSLGDLRVVKSGRVFSLRNSVTLDTTEEYEYRPSGCSSAHIALVNNLRNLRVVELVLNASKFEEDYSVDERETNQLKLKEFCLQVGKIWSIRRLKIMDSNIDFRGFVRSFPQLDYIDITRSDTKKLFTDADIEFLKSKIKRLALVECEDGLKIFSALADSPGLVRLHLDVPVCSKEVFLDLQKANHLQRLTFGSPQIPDNTLKWLLQLPQLYDLKLDYQPSQLAIFQESLRRQKTLQVLRLYNTSPSQVKEIDSLNNGVVRLHLIQKPLFGI